jgi:hypothetical protein
MYYTKNVNLSVIILSIVAAIIAFGLFFGYLRGVGKSFQKTPTSSIQSSKLKDQQREAVEETRRRQRQLMEDLKDRTGKY